MKFVGFAALTLAAAPAIALAQPVDKPGAVDESKPVTREEISAKLDADYDDLDGDKDGKVTAAEINARLVKRAAAEIEALKKKRDDAFAKLDANGDGTVTKAEFDEKAKLPAIKEPDAKPFLDQFDRTKDSTISRDEFRLPTLANFDRMDKNKDGIVTPEELKEPALPPARKPAVKETPPIGR